MLGQIQAGSGSGILKTGFGAKLSGSATLVWSPCIRSWTATYSFTAEIYLSQPSIFHIYSNNLWHRTFSNSLLIHVDHYQEYLNDVLVQIVKFYISFKFCRLAFFLIFVWCNIQGGQLNMALCFWYLVKSDLSNVQCTHGYRSVHWTLDKSLFKSYLKTYSYVLLVTLYMQTASSLWEPGPQKEFSMGARPRS